jgi:hypothetical protein
VESVALTGISKISPAFAVGPKKVNSSRRFSPKTFSISAINDPTKTNESSGFLINPTAIELADEAAFISSGAAIGNADMIGKASALEKELLLN